MDQKLNISVQMYTNSIIKNRYKKHVFNISRRKIIDIINKNVK